MAGFSYRGKNIGDFGDIHYAPEASQRGEQALPYEVNEESAGGRPGEYYYGNRVLAREFILRCFYENMTTQAKNDVLRWFGRNTKGQLIFDDRPYVYYDVIPNMQVEMENYKTSGVCGGPYSGMMAIHLKAYCPFGHLLSETDEAANDETLILPADRMPGTSPV